VTAPARWVASGPGVFPAAAAAITVDVLVGPGVPLDASTCVDVATEVAGDAFTVAALALSVAAVAGSGKLVEVGSVVAVGGTEVTTTGV